ncbi:oxidoreductase [Streptomyces sp. NPDC006551]|uniref:oxidoreductase n=1 Tax=Streptomyces sp. NPDC006551 TaxID=3157178 RepID=UPI0033B9EAA9
MTHHSGPYGYGYAPPPPPPKPGVIPLVPLKLSEILTGAFATLGRYWKPLLGVTGAAYGTALLVVGAACWFAYAAVGEHLAAVFDASGREPSWDDVRPLLIAFGCVWLVAMITMIAASGVMYAACPAVLQEAVLGRPTTFSAVWRRARASMPAVLGTVFLTMLLMLVPIALFGAAFIGLMVAVVAAADGSGSVSWALPVLALLGALATVPPVTWVWVKLSLAPSAAVFERQRAVAAMRRSWRLVDGSWWRIFGSLLVAGLISGMAGSLFQAFAQVFSTPASFTAGATAPESPGEVLADLAPFLAITLILSLIGQIVASVFPPLVTSLLYVDQRIRKENLAPALLQAAGEPSFTP